MFVDIDSPNIDSIMAQYKAKIDEKGAIIPPKALSKKLNLKEGDEIILTLENDELLIEKSPSPLSELLTLPPLIISSVESLEQEMNQLRQGVEKQVENQV
ncbi:MAG: AbrB/MazE/SpoVT family DNA-binding domain-containing protein [Candidatus Heimdallarchaeota archaeon]|nr:AbrB/MazE/SpoVT family DNA-binding domain-containing protein [Candidatus Heimdallarchaeota archaeon]